jgi:hypothetical protein
MPPKYYDDALVRVQTGIKKFTPIVNQAKSRSLNEADTRDIVKAMIHELLGFDPFFEVTGEFSIKGQFADFAVKSNDKIVFFVEVKSIDTKLDDKHLFQVIGYAANHGTEWAVLTNSDRWIVYRLFAGDAKSSEVVMDFSLLDAKPAEAAQLFLKFSKEGFRVGAITAHWDSVQALNPKRVAQTLCQEPMITALRKELMKQSGIKVDDNTVRDIVLNQILRGDLADHVKHLPFAAKSVANRSS